MHETQEDVAGLQELLDRSHAAGGPHLRSIITPEWRLNANELVERLQGMRLLVVATVTADGRPLTGPVDGVFFRGAFHFGSSPESFRLRHLRVRPQVSATHLPGEDLSVTVHGTAVPVDVRDPRNAGFRQTLLDIYVPRYGADWEQFLDGGPRYIRIRADKMFTLHMPPPLPPGDGGIS